MSNCYEALFLRKPTVIWRDEFNFLAAVSDEDQSGRHLEPWAVEEFSQFALLQHRAPLIVSESCY